MGFSAELSIKVYDDEEGEYLEVRPDSDSLGMIDIYDSYDIKNGYKLRMNPAQAAKLAEALNWFIELHDKVK